MDINQLVHNLRNPLNAISMNAELGKMSIEQKSDLETATRAFNNILKQCESCAQTLESLSNQLANEKE